MSRGKETRLTFGRSLRQSNRTAFPTGESTFATPKPAGIISGKLKTALSRTVQIAHRHRANEHVFPARKKSRRLQRLAARQRIQCAGRSVRQAGTRMSIFVAGGSSAPGGRGSHPAQYPCPFPRFLRASPFNRVDIKILMQHGPYA